VGTNGLCRRSRDDGQSLECCGDVWTVQTVVAVLSLPLTAASRFCCLSRARCTLAVEGLTSAMAANSVLVRARAVEQAEQHARSGGFGYCRRDGRDVHVDGLDIHDLMINEVLAKIFWHTARHPPELCPA